MADVILTYFCMIGFPHKGGIVAINQLTFFTSDFHVTGSVPLIGETIHSYHHVEVGMLKDSPLMGTFLLPPPPLPDSSPLVAYINMISSSTILTNPWIVPNETNIHSFSDRMPLSSIDLDYKSIYSDCETYSLSSINWVDQ